MWLRNSIKDYLEMSDTGDEAMPSLIDYHIARLNDKNAKVRAASARELGLLGDPAALSVLEELFKVEPDPDVKVAIQEAGRILYKKKRSLERGGQE